MKRALSEDTSLEAENLQLELFRRMTPARKLALVAEANRAVELFALAGIRSRHPEWSEERCRREWFGQLLGEELATRVYGPVDAG